MKTVEGWVNWRHGSGHCEGGRSVLSPILGWIRSPQSPLPAQSVEVMSQKPHSMGLGTLRAGWPEAKRQFNTAMF